MNLPITHCNLLVEPIEHEAAPTYTLSLQVRASQTVHVFVEVHHLEAVELVCNFLNLFLFSRLNNLDTWSIPLDVCARSFLVLSACFNCAAGNLAIVYILNSMMAHRASFNLRSAHLVL